MRGQNSVSKNIKENRRTIDELKNRQQVGGDNVLFYRYYTDDDYDLASYVEGTIRTYLITYEYTTATDRYGITYFNIYYRIDNSNVMANPQGFTSTAPFVSIAYGEVGAPERGATNFILRVINNTYNGGSPSNHTAYMKFYAYGTAAGTFSIQEL